MKLFQQLGDEVEATWRAANYHEELLPAIAADALHRADLPAKVSAWDVVEWSLKQTELPRQRDLHASFADPPITVYSGPRFHVDVYFWFEGSTTTHQHHFCGAFQVLLGSSIHSWYEFDRRESINIFTEIGDIRLKQCELLEVGDVQEIRAGKQYIHSLFHLDQPSATIVVRTDRSPLHLPQYEYHKPSLAIDPFFEQPTTTKQLQTMATLIRAGRPEADRAISAFLEASDFQTSFLILSRLRNLLRSNQMAQFFDPERAQTRFDGFLEIACKKHGSAGEALRPVFERFDILDEIMRLRSYVTNAEHRFFLALLLNVEGRERIFGLIKRRFPDADPIEKILDWTFDLAETRLLGFDNSNALGIPGFGDAEMFVLENILRDKTEDEIALAFLAEKPEVGHEAILGAIGRIRNSAIFRSIAN